MEQRFELSSVAVMLAAEGIEKISVVEFMKIVDSLVAMYPGLCVDKTKENFASECRRHGFMKWKSGSLLLDIGAVPVRYVGYAMDDLDVRHGLCDTLRSLIHEARDASDGSVAAYRKDVDRCRRSVDKVLKKCRCRIVPIMDGYRICAD
jgi:hypothetical protein